VRRVPFSSFARPNSFSAVSWASGPVFMFCGPRLVFGGTEGVGSLFHILRSWTRFRRYCGRRVPFSCFMLPNSFSSVPSASGPIFMFCAPRLVFVISVFMFCARTRFRRYRGRQVPFSCFALRDTFSTVLRASRPFFMFCTPGLVFDGNGGVGSRFYVLLACTHFQRYGGRPIPFSRFALQDSFSVVSRASGPFFIFCAPGLIFDGTEGVGSRFHVLRSRTHF
jgi:hypothetical protein